MKERFCERCGKPVEQRYIVYLTLDQRTGTYTKRKVPEQYSQGSFLFGGNCSRILLLEDELALEKVILDQSENEDSLI